MHQKNPALIRRFIFCAGLLVSASAFAGSGNAQTSPASPAALNAPAATPKTPSTTTRHRRRRYTSQQSAQPASIAPSAQTVGPTPAQRQRDAQILAAQQKQSAETARQQAIVTGNVIKEREAQQSEPRIQDAPGPGSQPLAGEPAVPAAQSSDPQGIQDAPGPAQTLPQAPPTPPAPQTQPAAPQE